MINDTRTRFESLLNHQREKLLVELEKISKRIEEFSDYGELDQMKQYVDDTKNISKRISEAEKLVEWIRNVFLFEIFKINLIANFFFN